MGTHILTQQVTSSWQKSHKLFASTTIFVKMQRILRGEPEHVDVAEHLHLQHLQHLPEHVDVAEPKEGKQGNDVPPLHPELAEP